MTATEDVLVVVEEPAVTVTETVTPQPTTTAATPSSGGSSSPVLATLAGLPVKGRAPKTGYTRSAFGQAWSDDASEEFGHNGCDTRNDVLRRDLTALAVKPGTNGCVALSGTLVDPYTGKRIPFIRGRGTSSAVQIDHVVSLSNAWQTGAQKLTYEQRQDFANDPMNLLAVGGPTNQQKGDGDAATWLPPRKSYRCEYAARQVAVKHKHALYVTSPEAQGSLTRFPGHLSWGDDRLGEESGRCLQPSRWSSVVGRWR
ncbi:HNH endonuclease family protein [Janibacter massiliensis]|uniref:HNH endonuclease family protein n=1 Tax=Janibacter massiliensis TaxID=2058291 RepID=UPI001F1AD8EF|nr:HNH endonuclease family protein [Janibacter massiliensis]